MKNLQDLSAIPDDDLPHRLAVLLDDSRHTEADLVAHIGEVDARKLYAREATPSMFQYCTERLHLSGAEAYLRIAAGRAAREHPLILAMLADGRLHLTAIGLLAPHLTARNRDVLLARATHKTKREIEELLAEIAPRPDAPALIRKLPTRWTTRATEAASRPVAGPRTTLSASCRPPSPAGVTDQAASADLELRPDEVASPCSDGTISPESAGVPPPESEPRAYAAGAVARLSQGDPESHETQSSQVAASQSASIQPLSPARYRVQFTASAELRGKLERLRALMRTSVPDGDLAAIIEAAVTEKLESLEARRLGRTKRPIKRLLDTDTTPRTRHIPAPVKRIVHARDEGRCAFVDGKGRRCTACVGLQFHHRHTFATGGDHSPANLSLLCSGHNRYLAEIDYGREAVARHEPPKPSGFERPARADTKLPGRPEPRPNCSV